MKRFTLSLACLCFAALASAGGPERMDLAGLWRFQLDPMGFGKTAGSELYLARLTETIHLPGSTDEGAKGVKNTVSHVDRLSRKYEYCGQAWYQREVTVPADWAGRSVSLELERCHWETAVYVDGRPVGTDERLSTPNRFDLTPYLTPGTHTLTLCVDNRLKYPMDQWDHGTTEYTQTNWNGVVGRLELVARTRGHIADVQLYPDVEAGAVRVKAGLTPAGEDLRGRLTLTVREKGGPTVAKRTLDVALDYSAATQVDELVSLGRDVRLWDEFTPALYEVEASLATEQGTDTRRETFGMRRVEQGRHHVRVNGRNVHLRGSLECCVFPLTGYPATDTASWKRIFRTAKEYGLNHIRFHSWCPPEAAFDAADEVGIYLQAELPMWVKDVGKYPARRDFFEREMYAILDEYGNHPSFVLMCGGNENEGDFTVLEDLVLKAQRHDPRRLYSASTARTHVKADQFYVSHVTGNGWITVYEGQPSTDWDRSKESAVDVPVIAHETGQRCMYPNFGEMAKYSGVLEPRNFAVFRDRLARNGMLGQADDFFRATGAHTVLQYKEVNESLLRSATSGGFQLLGLTDFPGQGCAYVGILDAFWETKGLVTPEKYRESCGPMVLLARLPKRVYLNSEHFTARLGLYHYGPDDLGRGRIGWHGPRLGTLQARRHPAQHGDGLPGLRRRGPQRRHPAGQVHPARHPRRHRRRQRVGHLGLPRRGRTRPHHGLRPGARLDHGAPPAPGGRRRAPRARQLPGPQNALRQPLLEPHHVQLGPHDCRHAHRGGPPGLQPVPHGLLCRLAVVGRTEPCPRPRPDGHRRPDARHPERRHLRAKPQARHRLRGQRGPRSPLRALRRRPGRPHRPARHATAAPLGGGLHGLGRLPSRRHLPALGDRATLQPRARPRRRLRRQRRHPATAQSMRQMRLMSPMSSGRIPRGPH